MKSRTDRRFKASAERRRQQARYWSCDHEYSRRGVTLVDNMRMHDCRLCGGGILRFRGPRKGEVRYTSPEPGAP